MLVGIQLSRRFATTLTPHKITQLLSANEVSLERGAQEAAALLIPSYIRSIECNQLAANNPIEDRLRISSLRLPGCREPTLILGVFDGHGGGTTANLISRRLFNYIALALHPAPGNLEISTQTTLTSNVNTGDDYLSTIKTQQQQKRHLDRASSSQIVDLHHSPMPSVNSRLQQLELNMLNYYKSELTAKRGGLSPDTSLKLDVAANLRTSFQRCDDDLSHEIQQALTTNSSNLDQEVLRHYLSASVSGCCAIVMVIHEGCAYLASTGDCRAVLGVYDGQHGMAAGASRSTATTRGRNDGDQTSQQQLEQPQASHLKALELNDEHNCDNINEIRRLSASHPRSEQNTMIKHNRLLGHLMPFRAFGDFTYKWPADLIRACGITRAFGPAVIPASYDSPPYLIVEPDVRVMRLDGDECRGSRELEQKVEHDKQGDQIEPKQTSQKYLVMASDGLWELFESSRDVIETIVDHSLNSQVQGYEEDYDTNCATYVLRSALRSGPHQDIGMDRERTRRLNHVRLESTLTLPKSVVRNYRDDISLILMKLDY